MTRNTTPGAAKMNKYPQGEDLAPANLHGGASNVFV
jgi:hypothetical protein